MTLIGQDYQEEGFKPLIDKTIQAQLADLFGLIYQAGPAPAGGAVDTGNTGDLGLPTTQVVTLLRRIYSQTGMNEDKVDSAILQVQSYITHLDNMSGYWNGVLSTLEKLKYNTLAAEGREDDYLYAEGPPVYKPRDHRGLRKEFDRQEQEVAITKYQKDLGSVYQDWLETSAKRGMSPGALVDSLDRLAAAVFPSAFLKGKRQAFPAAKLTAHDEQKIAHELRENKRFLQSHLTVAIQQKAHDQNLHDDPEDFVSTLSKSFDSRIQNLYGGRLWAVTEAGYLAGVREVRHRMRMRLAR